MIQEQNNEQKKKKNTNDASTKCKCIFQVWTKETRYLKIGEISQYVVKN